MTLADIKQIPEEHLQKIFLDRIIYLDDTKLRYLLKSQTLTELINLNLNRLLKDAKDKIRVIESLKLLDNNIDLLKEYQDDIIGAIIGYDSSVLKDAGILAFFTELLKELALNEKQDIFQIRKIDYGTFSDVYQLGNKIIKIGSSRAVNKLIYHPCLLLPLLRRQFSINENNKNTSIFIEVYQRAQTDFLNLVYELNPEEEAYYLYRELRKSGLIWLDCKEDNIGILLEDNIPHIKGIEEVCLSSLMMEDTKVHSNRIRKKGEFVILDLDHIITEEEFYNTSENIDCIFSKFSNAEKRRIKALEERYKKEVKPKKSKFLKEKTKNR